MNGMKQTSLSWNLSPKPNALVNFKRDPNNKNLNTPRAAMNNVAATTTENKDRGGHHLLQ